ncbi:MAG: sigma-70 family RNA polymerase sigma factor [Pirellulales bacterium]|nr:sigma-70 family RNA polymerase sigma factor [Pirellulales bacterium]
MAVSDHELMRRLKSGDGAAFDDLVRRWQAPLCRILAKLANRQQSGDITGGDLSDRDDLVQEVFLRVFQARDRYRPAAEFSTWLYRIALNVARDASRRQRRRPAVSFHGKETFTAGNAGKNGAPEESALHGERRNLISAALQELPDKLREPLILRHFADLSFPQIAVVLKTPCTTIKSRVHLALKQLEAALRRQGIDESEWES